MSDARTHISRHSKLEQIVLELESPKSRKNAVEEVEVNSLDDPRALTLFSNWGKKCKVPLTLETLAICRFIIIPSSNPPYKHPTGVAYTRSQDRLKSQNCRKQCYMGGRYRYRRGVKLKKRTKRSFTVNQNTRSRNQKPHANLHDLGGQGIEKC